ncbi:tRNA 2'-phosphotransferase 1, partial [Durusdinium trenchii]
MSKWQWKDYRRQDSWSVKQSWKSRDYSDYNKQWRRSHSWSDSSWQDGDSEVQDSVHRPVRSADDLGQEYVIHGTFLPAWLKIRTEGLKTMDGEYIHMCLGLPGKGAMSEIRKDCDVAVFIDIIRAIQAGIKFWQSSNGVILTNGEGNSQTVRPEFFLRVLWLGPGGQQLVIFDKYGDQTDTNRKDDKDFNAALQKAEWAEHGATQNGATRKGRPDTGGMRPSEPEAPPKQCRPNPPTPPQPPSASRDHDARWWTEASMVSEDVHYRSSMRDEQASGGSGYGNRKGWQKDWSWEDKHLSHRPNSQPSTEGSTSAPLASLALGQ